MRLPQIMMWLNTVQYDVSKAIWREIIDEVVGKLARLTNEYLNCVVENQDCRYNHSQKHVVTQDVPFG
jgi:hypothetical protein